eukprot:tig00000378_g24503.t1
MEPSASEAIAAAQPAESTVDTRKMAESAAALERANFTHAQRILCVRPSWILHLMSHEDEDEDAADEDVGHAELAADDDQTAEDALDEDALDDLDEGEGDEDEDIEDASLEELKKEAAMPLDDLVKKYLDPAGDGLERAIRGGSLVFDVPLETIMAEAEETEEQDPDFRPTEDEAEEEAEAGFEAAMDEEEREERAGEGGDEDGGSGEGAAAEHEDEEEGEDDEEEEEEEEEEVEGGKGVEAGDEEEGEEEDARMEEADAAELEALREEARMPIEQVLARILEGEDEVAVDEACLAGGLAAHLSPGKPRRTRVSRGEEAGAVPAGSHAALSSPEKPRRTTRVTRVTRK